jgi:hypothetical protein
MSKALEMEALHIFSDWFVSGVFKNGIVSGLGRAGEYCI